MENESEEEAGLAHLSSDLWERVIHEAFVELVPNDDRADRWMEDQKDQTT